jgi:hypothetical protein
MYYDNIIGVITQVLEGRDYPHTNRDPRIDKYHNELVDEDSVKEVARDVAARPALLISVGDPDVLPDSYDSTYRVSTDSIPLEIIVAYSNLRDPAIQKEECRAIAFEVRRALQGVKFEAPQMAEAVFVTEGLEHIGTTKGLTLYSVMMRLVAEVSMDADDPDE